jgi:prolyl-tRNA synthetase
MLQSKLFTKTSKSVPADEVSVNAKLLTQAGFIDKQMAGVYSFLPLGYRVVKKVEQIIREEMNAVDGQELAMTSLQPKELWQKSERWVTPEEIMFKVGKAGEEPNVGLAWTHEEPITEIAKRFISSYRDLPKAVYQFQTKFRNEPRAKSGIIRMREFVMKDLYSFHVSEADLDGYYERVKEAYLKVFTRCGLESLVVEASGGAFTKKFSHEFQVLTEAGEDYTVYCPACKYAQNREVAQGKVGQNCTLCGKAQLIEGKSVEVGNIFKLGTKFSEALGLYFTDEVGKQKPVVMASYGIGPGRVMGTVVEVHHDNVGMIWPDEIAPFRVHVIALGSGEPLERARALYTKLQSHGVEVLFDDRDEQAGAKLKDADLIGIPWRAVVSAKTGEKVELKGRTAPESSMVTETECLSTFSVQ